MVDSSCNIHKISLAMRPIHEDEPCATTTSLARVMAEDNAVVATPVVPTALDRATAVAVEVVELSASILNEGG